MKSGNNFLASSVDPEKEAKCWLEKNSSMIERNPVVIILGVGSGYHLAEVAFKYPGKKILAIDFKAQTREFFRKQFPLESAHVNIIIGSNYKQLLATSMVKNILGQRYSVVMFRGACSQDRDEFTKLKLDLLGRSIDGAKNILLARNIKIVNRIQSVPKMVGLLDIIGLDERRKLSHRDRCIMNVLDELIA